MKDSYKKVLRSVSDYLLKNGCRAVEFDVDTYNYSIYSGNKVKCTDGDKRHEKILLP